MTNMLENYHDNIMVSKQHYNKQKTFYQRLEELPLKQE